MLYEGKTSADLYLLITAAVTSTGTDQSAHESEERGKRPFQASCLDHAGIEHEYIQYIAAD